MKFFRLLISTGLGCFLLTQDIHAQNQEAAPAGDETRAASVEVRAVYLNDATIDTTMPAQLPQPAKTVQEPDAMATNVTSVVAPQGPTEPTWTISDTDRSLKELMTRWSRNSDWQLCWDLPVDYPLVGRMSITGSFESAVEKIVTNMRTAEHPFKIVFYKGNRVVRVASRGDQ
jgi:hypothetical protein